LYLVPISRCFGIYSHNSSIEHQNIKPVSLSQNSLGSFVDGGEGRDVAYLERDFDIWGASFDRRYDIVGSLLITTREDDVSGFCSSKSQDGAFAEPGSAACEQEDFAAKRRDLVRTEGYHAAVVYGGIFIDKRPFIATTYVETGLSAKIIVVLRCRHDLRCASRDEQ